MKHLLMTTTALLLISASTAHASKPMTMEQMQQQLELLSQKVDKLSNVVEKQQQIITAQKSQIESQDAKLAEQNQKVTSQSQQIGKLAAITPAAGGAAKEDSGVKVTMNPLPKISSADGKYSLAPTARFHYDVTAFSDDKTNQPTGASLRRLRLGFKGDLGEDFNYKVEADFANDGTVIKETYLAYTGMNFADLWVGSFKPAVGLEQNTSTNYLTFIENTPATNAFTRDEILGGALKGGEANWSWALGVFNERAGVNNTTRDEAVSVDGRMSANLLGLMTVSKNVLHAGVGASHRKPNSSVDSVTLSGRPSGAGTNLVTTGALADTDRSTVLNPEIAGVFGPFWFQGEYFRNWLDRRAMPDPVFDGWYAQAGWILTGETRPYQGKTGNFDRIKPKAPFSLKDGGWGAWEVLARYDNLDLNDSGAGITGGEMDDWTVGINWYLRDNVRMMFDYEFVNTDSSAPVPDDDPQVFSMRVQYDF
jgi:phosphate-selective porin OprO and OprP